jgi:hypothetical protein
MSGIRTGHPTRFEKKEPPAISKWFRICSPLFFSFYVCVTLAQENSGLTIVKQSHVETRRGPTGALIVSNTPGVRGDEGYLVFFMIRSSAGSRLDEMSIAGGSKALLLFSVSADTKYELLSYVRDCNGNCLSLGRPTDECRAPFTLKPNQTLYAKRIRGPQSAKSASSCLVFSPQP